MAITLGILIAYLVGLVFSTVNWQYHAMFGIGALPGIMMIVIAFFMEESTASERTSYGEIGNSV
jgi:MFS family permease